MVLPVGAASNAWSCSCMLGPLVFDASELCGFRTLNMDAGMEANEPMNRAVVGELRSWVDGMRVGSCMQHIGVSGINDHMWLRAIGSYELYQLESYPICIVEFWLTTTDGDTSSQQPVV